MNDWYFLSYKQWWAIFVHHVTWRVFLYLMVVVTNKRDTSRAGGLTEKKNFACIFRLFCKEKCQCRQAVSSGSGTGVAAIGTISGSDGGATLRPSANGGVVDRDSRAAERENLFRCFCLLSISTTYDVCT